ncbi:MAG TPA: ornithine--oxo-acid transaminase, partial [Chitinophagaceae bacterium]|nr:ornithine--oxo-acid transaminase [Chitinophagaceae bacterium]
AMEALQVLKDEHMADNAATLGVWFRTALQQLDSPLIASVRGKGLLNAVVINHP